MNNLILQGDLARHAAPTGSMGRANGPQPWIKEWSVQTPKGRKAKVKPVVNPIFERCAEVCLDDSWKEMLRKAARGKFPRQFRLQQGILTYSKQNKTSQLDIPQDVTMLDNVAIVKFNHDLLEFFRSTGITTNKDDDIAAELHERYIQENECREPAAITWKDSSQGYREDLLAEYAVRMGSVMGLTEGEVTQCFQTLKYWSKLGTLDNNVIINGRNISRVEGLCWDPQERKFFLASIPLPVNINNSIANINYHLDLRHFRLYNKATNGRKTRRKKDNSPSTNSSC